MADLPVIGAQLSTLNLDAHRDWLAEKNRDLELVEFCMADILRDPDPFTSIAKAKLDGWHGRLGIHGPFYGFELDVKDADIRAVVQKRMDQALDVCAALGARQMVVHSPYDYWDQHNLDNTPRGRENKVSAILKTLGPALKRAENQGVTLVLENIKDADAQARAMVVKAADSPALKLSIDTGHAYWAHRACGAQSVGEFVTIAGADLCHVHLQGSDGHADRHWPLDQGDTDWAEIFAALAKTGATPHLIVEINDFTLIKRSVAHLAALGLGQ